MWHDSVLMAPAGEFSGGGGNEDAEDEVILFDDEGGKDYHFISVDDFKSKIEMGEFIEYEEVYPGLFYGTLKSEVQKIWNDGGIVIYDMDVVGGVFGSY